MARRDLRSHRAQEAVDSIGLGFDLTQDVCFHNFKSGKRLIKMDEQDCGVLNIPGGLSILNVPKSIKCRAGESFRVHSEVLTFDQMSGHFNEGMGLKGSIPSGHFCSSFGLWGRHTHKDVAATVKSLAYEGCFMRRYVFELQGYGIGGEPHDHVKQAVPSSWNPKAFARFIERFGTHVIVGVTMGGKDVVYIRQEQDDPMSSKFHHHPTTSLLKLLKDKASMRFTDSADQNHCLPSQVFHDNKENNIAMIYDRRGGSKEVMRHSEWLETVELEPDVISAFLLPLPAILMRTAGIGYLTHAINLYIRHKPPMEDLHRFLEFLLPRQWAPEHSETHLGSHWKNQVKSGLRLGILGPTLYINTIPVDIGKKPVTGLSLRLEGAKSNRLAIHLQHLTCLPMGYPLSENANANSYSSSCDPNCCNFHKKLKRGGFAYVCTAPVESDDSVSIVTGAQLQVARNCLHLLLHFSKVVGATLKKSPEWDQSFSIRQLSHNKHGAIISTSLSIDKGPNPKPGEVTIASNKNVRLPAPVHPSKLQRFVDTREMIRGSEDTPGYWVVSGARLSVQNGKICLFVKYSLLTISC